MSKPLHNFHIQICNFGQCNVGVVFKWKVHHGNNWADTVDSNRLSIVLARICPTVLFEFVPIMSIVQLGFVKEAELYFGQNKANQYYWPVLSGGVWQWRMPGVCIKFPNICLVAIIDTVQPCTICLTFRFMLCREAINAEAIEHTLAKHKQLNTACNVVSGFHILAELNFFFKVQAEFLNVLERRTLNQRQMLNHDVPVL